MEQKRKDPVEHGEDEFLLLHCAGDSPRMRELRKRISTLNKEENASLVRVIHLKGETGAGKNYYAGVIAAHRRWLQVKDTKGFITLKRLDVFHDRYLKILLTALPDSLIESELFGHKAGSFSGASKDKDKLGLLADPNRDDILLDEIGDATAAVQTKLLAVMEGHEFLPVGGSPGIMGKTGDEKRCSARLLVATNQPLQALILDRRFREDLYWRINECTLHIPALREQKENIPAIAKKVLHNLWQTWKNPMGVETTPAPPELSKADLEWASGHKWPGNVRQLEHAIKIWLLEGTTRSLKETVEQIDRDRGSSETVADQAVLNSAVRVKLDGIVSGHLPSPGSLDGFLKDFRSVVIRAFLDWYDTNKPNNEQICQMFPDAKDATTLKSKLSQWRRELK